MRTAFKFVLAMLVVYVAYLIYKRYFYYRMVYSGGSVWPYCSWMFGNNEGFSPGSVSPAQKASPTAATDRKAMEVQTYLDNSKYSSMVYSHHPPQAAPSSRW